MEIHRKELCDYMNDIEHEIREKSVEEQKHILIKKASDLLNLKGIQVVGSIQPNPQMKFLSPRQIVTLKNALLCIDRKQFLDAYWEIFDFIYDYAEKSNSDINAGEYELLIFQLEMLLKSIKEDL